MALARSALSWWDLGVCSSNQLSSVTYWLIRQPGSNSNSCSLKAQGSSFTFNCTMI
ncbi:hypothetical protein DPMN_042040 [Dreissena polymorpha]|uniref:Uncharacterized protein n=1 Tax=Dreissena polymorpha TaxID=45954 RepID=A0A9D4CZT5_DREPO|nr:hypothetical protein DPMN_042040 [Dreissena polymorpha]